MRAAKQPGVSVSGERAALPWTAEAGDRPQWIMVTIFRAAFLSFTPCVLGIHSGFGMGRLLFVPLHQRGMVPAGAALCSGPCICLFGHSCIFSL